MLFSNKYRYIIIVVTCILLIVQLALLDKTNFHWKDSFGIIAPILIIISMVLSIRSVNNEKNN